MTASAIVRRSRSALGPQLVAALLIAWSAARAAAAQEPALPATADALEVVLVDVEVWVHDRDGRPVRGLEATDFVVLEDGVPVPLTHFAEMGARSAVGTGVPGESPLPQTGEPSAPAASEDAGHLVLYFDQLHSSPASTRRLVRDLRQFLADSPLPAERVLVVRQSFDLHTEAATGSSRQEIDAALTRVAERQGSTASDARLALARLQSLWDQARERPNPCRSFAASAKGEIAARVAELERLSAITLQNLRATIRLLAGLPGPKTLLFASDSLETRPGVELVRFAQNACPDERELREATGDAAHLGRRLLGFAEEANRQRVTIYPFQASGLQPSPLTSADQRALDADAVRGVDSLLRTGQRDGLLELARQTGGWAVVGRNRYAADLERLRNDMTTYYSLAYQPPRPADGRSHAIEVRLVGERAKGTRLRHRLGYRNESGDEELQRELEGAIAFGVMRNPLAVRLAVGALAPTGDGRYAVPLHVLVPSAGIAFLGEAGSERAWIGVTVHAADARGSQVVKRAEGFRPARPPAAGLLDLRLSLELPQGVHVLAVAVRDELTSESSVVATTVAIEDPAAGAPERE